MAVSIAVLEREVVDSVVAAEDGTLVVPGPTLGKLCLKATYSSVAGFCEFLLLMGSVS